MELGLRHKRILSLLVILTMIGAALTSFGFFTPQEAAASAESWVKYNIDASSIDYQNSNAQKWCKKFYVNIFSDYEKNFIIADPSGYDTLEINYDYEYYIKSTLDDTKTNDYTNSVFLLSTKEVETLFENRDARVAKMCNGTNVLSNNVGYWLRTPHWDDTITNQAEAINYQGYTVSTNVTQPSYCMRPAFYLNLSSDIKASEKTAGKDADENDITALTPDEEGTETISFNSLSAGDHIFLGNSDKDALGLIDFTGLPYWRVLSKDEATKSALLISEYLWYGDAAKAPEVSVEEPQITKQPSDVTMELGETGNAVSVEASVTAGTLTYQWYSNTTDSTTDGTEIEGATETSYSIPSDSEIGTKYYYCVVTNTVGDTTKSVTSETAAVTVVKEYVAINVEKNVKYGTLQAALDAAEDTQTVKLLKDVKEHVTFGDNKYVTLDLDDHGISAAEADKSIITITNGTLKLADNAEEKTTHKYSLNEDGVAEFSENGDKSFEGGYIYGAKEGEDDSIAVHGIAIISQGSLIMEAGTIIGNYSGSEGGGIVVSGYKGYGGDPNDNVSFTMNGGNILGNRGEFGGGISCRGHEDCAFMTINGGTISYNRGEQHSGAINVGNTTTITGGTITFNHVEQENDDPIGGAIEFKDRTPSSLLTLSGDPVIQNNTRTTSDGITEESNITLSGYSQYGSQYAPCQFTLGTLSDNAKIGVSILDNNEKSLGVFTVGSTEENSANAYEKGLFTSDHGFYIKVHKSDDALNNQMELADPGFTVTGPEDITIHTGETGTLSVTSTPKEGNTGEMEYQWYKVDESGSTLIEGATSSTLTVGEGLTAGTYKYYCEVKFTPTGETTPISIDSEEATVTVLESQPVVITAADKEMTYSGQPVDIPVSGMFDIPSYAGAATYTVTNGTGEGTYDSTTGKLTVTKAGTFNVTVNTAATGSYLEGSASATLTIKKAEGAATVTLADQTAGTTDYEPTIASENYSTAAADITIKYFKKDGEAYTELTEKPSDEGEYRVAVTFKENDLYVEKTVTADYKITATPGPGPEPEPVPADKATYDDLTDSEKTEADKIVKKFNVDKDTAAKMLRTGEELGVPLDTMLLSTKAIKALKNDKDPAGSSFAKLTARAVKRGKTTMRLQWKTLPQADGYLIYANKCGPQRYKLSKTIKNGKTSRWNRKKLKKKTYYKYLVVAYKKVAGQKLPIAASVVVHCTTKSPKYTIAKSLKLNKKSLTVAAGKTAKLRSKEIKLEAKKRIQKHRVINYESLNPKIAKVNKKTGLVTGVSAGKTKIYVYCQNGVYKKVPVTVK